LAGQPRRAIPHLNAEDDGNALNGPKGQRRVLLALPFLPRLAEAISKIEYLDLDLSHLRWQPPREPSPRLAVFPQIVLVLI
jgi:hypothetical protein